MADDEDAVKESVEEFYRGLRDKYGRQSVGSFLDVLPALQAEIRKKRLTVFTSHEVFRVTARSRYSECFEDVLLSIIPDCSGAARVVFQSKVNPEKTDFSDLYEAGTLVPYDALIAAVAPYLDRLAERIAPDRAPESTG